MKGVNKRVIEIVEPDNEYIERVLVFMKPNKGDVKLARQCAEAEGFASNLVCVKKRSRMLNAVLYSSLGLVVCAVAYIVFAMVL